MTLIIGAVVGLLAIIALAIVIPTLIKKSRVPVEAADKGNKDPKAKAEKEESPTRWWSKVKFGPGWGFPILVWVAFWISLYRYLPGTWNFICDDPWIFWLSQGIYLVMIIGGRNLVDKDKKPRKPGYPKWMLFATVCIIVYGKLHGGTSHSAPPKHPAKQEAAADTKASPKPAQVTDTAKMEEESLPPIDVTVVVPGSDSRSKREVIAPVGYEIIDGTWTSKVQLTTQTELDDGSVASTFVSRTLEPVEVTFHLVPKKK